MFFRSQFVFALMLATLATAAHAADLAILRNGFSIRHDRRQVIDTLTRLYLSGPNAGYIDVPTTEIERFEKDQTPAPQAVQAVQPAAHSVVTSHNVATSRNLNELINSVSDRHHLDPDLVNSVIRAESGFNPRAVSPKGAQGLMQLMPKTASYLGVPNAFDPQANVEGGTRYLRELLERYDFDLVKALAAYNAGPHRVEQYRGVPPYYETRAYVARIIRDFNRKKLAQQGKSQVPAPQKRAAQAASRRSKDSGISRPVLAVSTQQSE